MCTVSYIPTDHGFFLTSNRDEHISRAKAIIPEKYPIGNHTFLFPKDPDKNGTWILAKSNGDLVVLLNGAFLNHKRALPYRESRGKILLDIMGSINPDRYFQIISLNQIEPFTLILFSAGKLRECRWDGEKKYSTILDEKMDYLWSSSTLYDKMALAKRASWFEDWRSSGNPKNSNEIIRFHSTAGKGDLKDGLIMNRDGKMKTVSITQIQYSKGKLEMNYVDLLDNLQHHEELQINKGNSLKIKELVENFKLKLRRFFIKIFHWEFWSFNAVYLPIMPFWFWLGIKSRSLFFFNTGNPSIENGGFAMERKHKIYHQIPTHYHPKTILLNCSMGLDSILEKLKMAGLQFPLMAKPDIGYQGILVKKIENESDLQDYLKGIKVDFLLQEFIAYKNEVGIFYFKIPGEIEGQISGLVGKEFMGVTGNNKSTIEELIMKVPRFLLQLPNLKKSHGSILNNVLKEGESLVLAPYGNHARGAKFIDQSHLITKELTQMVNHICNQIPEFYYGRLDIMYNNWEELCQGKNFSIVELNGAGSEPTHMYDPKHSLFFAWKEIIRHWKILYRISNLNQKKKGLKFLNFKEGIHLLRENTKYFKLIAGS